MTDTLRHNPDAIKPTELKEVYDEYSGMMATADVCPICNTGTIMYGVEMADESGIGWFGFGECDECGAQVPDEA